MILKKFEANEAGKDYVVGDIHGCFSKLQEQLDVLKFNRKTDRLFSVGDLVDRGPESERVLEWLPYSWFHAVRGNHEQMLLNFHEEKNSALQYASNGGRWFIDLDWELQDHIAHEVAKLPYAIEINTGRELIGIVHAQVPGHDWGEFDFVQTSDHREELLWERSKYKNRDDRRVARIDRVFVGHTPLKEVEVLGNVHYIDTGAVFKGGKLTVVEL